MAANQSENKTNPKKLVEEIAKIKTEDDQTVVAECLRIYSSLITSEESKKELINFLHWGCLDSLALCRPMTIFIIKSLNQPNENSAVIRSQWLHLLQEDFEAREALCNVDHDRFLGAVQLHGELYHSLLVNSTPFKVLAAPLVEYLNILLRSGFREDLSVLLNQLTINWKSLKSQMELECKKFMVELRQHSLRSPKPQILLAIDVTASGFPLDDLDEFYEKILLDEYLALKARVRNETFTPKYGKSFSKDSSVNIEAGKLLDVNLVRQRLFAKGLLPQKHQAQLPINRERNKITSVVDNSLVENPGEALRSRRCELNPV